MPRPAKKSTKSRAAKTEVATRDGGNWRPRPLANLNVRSASSRGWLNREIVNELLMSGMSPLEFLLLEMRDENNDWSRRLTCALETLPYMHPKLATYTAEGELEAGEGGAGAAKAMALASVAATVRGLSDAELEVLSKLADKLGVQPPEDGRTIEAVVSED